LLRRSCFRGGRPPIDRSDERAEEEEVPAVGQGSMLGHPLMPWVGVTADHLRHTIEEGSMYPHVIQFETHRNQAARRLQLLRDLGRLRASSHRPRAASKPHRPHPCGRQLGGG
jgi:hypothetical protein